MCLSDAGHRRQAEHPVTKRKKKEAGEWRSVGGLWKKGSFGEISDNLAWLALVSLGKRNV